MGLTMNKAARSQRLDTVFVLIIFSVFAVSVLIVLMLGASIYQNMAEVSQEGADERSVLAYIWTKSKNFNDAGMIYVSEYHGSNALMIDEELGGTRYQTIIYYYDGWLYELFSEYGLTFSPEDGVRVMRLSDLAFETARHGLIKVTSGWRNLFISPLAVSAAPFYE